VRLMLRRLLSDGVIVRVGFPPPVWAYEEYDEAECADRSGLRELVKRAAFRSRVGREIRKATLFMRLNPYPRSRLVIDWMQRHTRWLQPRRREFLYWIGSDVLSILEQTANGSLSEAGARTIARGVNLTVAPHLSMELLDAGIASSLLEYPKPLPEVSEDLEPLPTEFTVLTYLPTARFEFYGGLSIVEAARQLPDIRFRIIGGERPDIDCPKNMEFLGFLENPVPAFIGCSVFVRMTRHDGSPSSVIEALVLGRPVIHTYPVPHCFYVHFGDTAGLVRELRRLRSLSTRGLLGPNLDGAIWARAEFDPERCFERVLRRLVD